MDIRVTQWVTRAGGDAVVFSMESGGSYPWIGAYFTGEEWVPCKWDATGRFPSINETLTNSMLDLVEGG